MSSLSIWDNSYLGKGAILACQYIYIYYSADQELLIYKFKLAHGSDGQSVFQPALQMHPAYIIVVNNSNERKEDQAAWQEKGQNFVYQARHTEVETEEKTRNRLIDDLAA